MADQESTDESSQDFPTDADVDELQSVIDEMSKGMVVDLLPAHLDSNVTIGISVAVDALRDGEKEMAVAALKTAVAELEQ